jgi:GAF domain-containing protein
MPGSAQPVLDSVLQAALNATGALHGWILVLEGDALVVRAIIGADASLVGQRVGADAGFAGFVASSGQPIAMTPRPDDRRAAEGVAALAATGPASVLAVPCATDDTMHAVIELVGKHDGGPFNFDDVEIATLLGSVAGAALADDKPNGARVPSPRELGERLGRLASTDPARYATLAGFLGSMLVDE